MNRPGELPAPDPRDAALAEADDRIAGILESITDAFAIVDRGWKITALNQRAQEIGAALTGSDDPLRGRMLWDAMPQFDGTPVQRELLRAMSERIRIEVEQRYVAGDLEVWFEVRANPVREGLSIVLHEITMRKAGQDALRETANRLQLALDGGRLVDWKWDAINDQLTYGSRAVEWLGLPASQPMTRIEFREFVHADDRERARRAFDSAMAGKTDYAVEYRIIPPGASEKWLAINGHCAVGSGGRVLGMYGVAQDVTERKRAEDAQKRSEEDLRALADSIPQLAFIADRDGNVVWYNRGWYAYTGTTFDEMQHGGWQTVHKPEIRKLVLERWKQSLEAGVAFEMEFPLRAADGSFRWFLTRVNPVREAQGLVVRWFGTSTDVDLVKRAQEALRDETRLLELVNRTGTSLASKLDMQTLMQTLTDAATELSGARYGAFITSPEGDGVMSGGDASKLYVLSGVAHASLAAFGLPDTMPLFAPMLADQKAVRSDDVQTHPVFRSMIAQWTMPPGYPPVRSFLAVPVVSRAGPVLGALLFGHPEPRVFTVRSERLIVGIAAQAAVAIDNARLFEAAQRAATERAWLLESEKMARAEAERMSAIKDDFLATVSHELRSPLSAILGWSHVLRKQVVGTSQESELRKGLDTIERNARGQAQLIEDLLDMSRITSGKVRLDMQPVEPAKFVEAAVETIRPSAVAKGIRLEVDLDPNAGTIEGDPNRLQQVIGNLLSNAVKFTANEGEGGSIRVRLTRSDSDIAISVIDTGIGIKPDFLPQMFERFRQADSSTTRRYGGLGLGLAIVRHLAELHGGRVEARSEGEGRGSTFIVHLPVTDTYRQRVGHGRRSSDTQAADSYRTIDLKGTRVLVVDDDPDIRELVRRILTDCDADVYLAATAADALPIVEQDRPDVLISDIGMPDADGYELLRRVRALGAELGGRVPAIALTAFARSEDRTRALRAGFIAYVAKPVDPSELVATVASVTGRAG